MLERACVVVDVLEVAAAEFAEAAAWYEAAAPGLGVRFLDELERVFRTIEEMPALGSPWLLDGIPRGVRHVPLQTFRHVVIYVSEPRVVVVAVPHGSREPRYWIDRLEEI